MFENYQDSVGRDRSLSGFCRNGWGWIRRDGSNYNDRNNNIIRCIFLKINLLTAFQEVMLQSSPLEREKGLKENAKRFLFNRGVCPKCRMEIVTPIALRWLTERYI